MKPLVCPHCRIPFLPEIHNAWHQRYCSAKPCQRARNRASCRRWRQANPDYYRGRSDRRVRMRHRVLDDRPEEGIESWVRVTL